MTFELFLQHLANGISLGSLYALVAIGYTMVYGILRLINFAHGDIFMMAVYFAFFGCVLFGMPWYVSFVVAIALTGLLGIVIEAIAYKPLREGIKIPKLTVPLFGLTGAAVYKSAKEAPRITLLISSIGASYLLENLAIVIFGGRPKTFPQVPIFTNMVHIRSIYIQMLTFMIPVVTFALLIALMYLINKTKSGMAMRAVSKDIETARIMGIDVNRTISFTFGIGSLLAAVGGIMWGLKFPSILPLMGVMPGIKCFIAAVIGGIGNIAGAVVGGFILGIGEILLVAFLPKLSGYRDAFAFILLIMILLFRPTGIMGEKISEKV